MPYVHIGEASIHYRESGSGHDVILLLHAFPLHSGMWAPQLAALAPRFRVIAPDYRGLGLSRPAPHATNVELVAEDLLAMMRQLGIQRAAVAGVSMGGYVALELVRRAPQVVLGLALCDTKAVPDTEEQKAAREVYAQNTFTNGLGWVADDFAPKLLRPGADPETLETVRRLIGEGTAEGVSAAQRGMARRRDAVPTLPRIACPTLAIIGEHDQITPVGEVQRIAANVKGGRMLRIPAAGHLPNLEAPAAFNAALSTFFATVFAPQPVSPEVA